jgi:pyrroloquinoline quinone biosynthesis protein E
MNGFGHMRDTRTGEVPIVFRTDANSRRLTRP